MSFAGKFAQSLLNGLGLDIDRIDPLTSLANACGSDKGSKHASRHRYTRVYDELFGQFRDRKITLLEIGLHRPEADKRRPTAGHEGPSGAKGSAIPSLRMWADYLPHAQIIGFDVDDFRAFASDRIDIHCGDMSNRSDLEALARQYPDGFDIIIDDASHVSHHQQICFSYLFRHLKPGGFYVVEDLHWQDPNFERADDVKTKELLRKLQSGLGWQSHYADAQERDYLADHVEQVMLFDSLAKSYVVNNDALAVIRKSRQ